MIDDLGLARVYTVQRLHGRCHELGMTGKMTQASLVRDTLLGEMMRFVFDCTINLVDESLCASQKLSVIICERL